MADDQTPQKSVALIHNSALPFPLGKISSLLADECQRCDCRRPEIIIHVLDLADFDIPSSSSTPPPPQAEEESSSTAPTPAKRPLSDWQAKVSKHSGFILLFPYHIWSYCTPLKTALSTSLFPSCGPPHALTSAPVLLIGFGKADAWRATPEHLGQGWTQRTWSRKAFAMMREWVEQRGMKAVLGADQDDECWPEYNCYRDYWEAWESGGQVVFSGQQVEAFESAGWNRCQDGMRRMVGLLERRRVRGRK